MITKMIFEYVNILFMIMLCDVIQQIVFKNNCVFINFTNKTLTFYRIFTVWFVFLLVFCRNVTDVNVIIMNIMTLIGFVCMMFIKTLNMHKYVLILIYSVLMLALHMFHIFIHTNIINTSGNNIKFVY